MFDSVSKFVKSELVKGIYLLHVVIPGAAMAVQLVGIGLDHFLYFSCRKYVTYYQVITFQKPEQHTVCSK